MSLRIWCRSCKTFLIDHSKKQNKTLEKTKQILRNGLFTPENLITRDLLVYAEAHGARVMHYTDDMGLEADAVYQLADGRYALIEIKTGESKVPEAEKSLLKFKEVIRNHNERTKQDEAHPRAVYREPSALIVICANATMGYTTSKGVKVVPVGCMKD